LRFLAVLSNRFLKSAIKFENSNSFAINNLRNQPMKNQNSQKARALLKSIYQLIDNYIYYVLINKKAKSESSLNA